MWKFQCIYCTGILSVLTVSNTLDRVTFSSDKIANSPFGSSPVSWTSHTPAKSHQRQHCTRNSGLPSRTLSWRMFARSYPETRTLF